MGYNEAFVIGVIMVHMDTYWIRFAGLCCRVTSPPGVKHIVRKYFVGTYVSVLSGVPKGHDPVAQLSIRQKEATHNVTRLGFTQDGLRFTVAMQGSLHFYYPLLAQVLQRVFMVLFERTGGIVFHASAVESKGKAYVFVGESGRGKTTVARLSQHLYNLKVLADNQVFIRKYGGDFYVCPFPFSQFHKDGETARLAIAAFYLLHKSSSFVVRSLSFLEGLRALEREIQVLSASDIPSETSISPLLRRAIFDFSKSVTIRRLYFRKGKGIWEAIHNAS